VRISRDGRVIAFQSANENLVVNDTNRARDVYVASLPDLHVTRVSVSSSGSQLTQNSLLLGVSAEGARVLFETDRSLFVFDRSRDAIVVVPRDERGYKAADFASGPAAISGDGHTVTFGGDVPNHPDDALYVILDD
jgi:hypothetical protein